MFLFLLSVTLVSAGKLEVRGRTPDVFYDYEVDCSDEYWVRILSSKIFITLAI